MKLAVHKKSWPTGGGKTIIALITRQLCTIMLRFVIAFEIAWFSGRIIALHLRISNSFMFEFLMGIEISCFSASKFTLNTRVPNAYMLRFRVPFKMCLICCSIVTQYPQEEMVIHHLGSPFSLVDVLIIAHC